VKFGIIQFPGSTCDYDCFFALKDILNIDVKFIWHEETDLCDYDCIMLPGGFSYGDYLRVGAIARFSPVMQAVKEYAQKGGYVIGICNGFQILLEADLLPGVLVKNHGLHFLCRYEYVRIENDVNPFTHLCKKGQILKIPIAHGEGNYFIDDKGLKELNANHQVVLRYCDHHGEVSDNNNPNGSVDNIACICSKQGNVIGMMPHPERCVEDILGSSDGRFIFDSIIDSIKNKSKAAYKEIHHDNQ